MWRSLCRLCLWVQPSPHNFCKTLSVSPSINAALSGLLCCIIDPINPHSSPSWILQAAFMYQLQGRYLQNQVHFQSMQRPLVWHKIVTKFVMRSFCACGEKKQIQRDSNKQQEHWCIEMASLFCLFFNSLLWLTGHHVASGDIWSRGEYIKWNNQLHPPQCSRSGGRVSTTTPVTVYSS